MLWSGAQLQRLTSSDRPDEIREKGVSLSFAQQTTGSARGSLLGTALHLESGGDCQSHSNDERNIDHQATSCRAVVPIRTGCAAALVRLSFCLSLRKACKIAALAIAPAFSLQATASQK